MNKWPKQTVGDLNAFYGNPDADGNGTPDREWEDTHLTRLKPPYRMVLAWDTTKTVGGILVNKQCAGSLLRVLQAVLAHYGNQAAIEAAGMHLYGGAYAFRAMRGSHVLSVHSWGAAIDLDPEHNQFHSDHWSMPEEVIEAFRAEGWTWGGSWTHPDAMHFQAADI